MQNNVPNSVAQTEDNSFWAIIREAFSGTKRNLTEGSLAIALILLAIPMVSEMIMESLFALFDIFFVGKLGPDAIAVVGITESMIVIVYALAFGIAISATATIARRVGENDREGAAQTAVQILYLGLIVSVILGIIGVVFAPQLLTIMGAEPNVVALGTDYMRVMLGGNGVIFFLFLINAIFRGAGDAAIAMRVLWLANALNIILAPCFIFGLLFFPKLGVTGAAVGTTIGRGCGVLFALFYLVGRGNRFEIKRRHLAFQPAMVWKLTKMSASAALQTMIGMTSWTVLVRITSGFGSEAVAGYVIGLRIIIFALLPSVGMSNAAATMVGQSLGAGKPERAEKAVWSAALINAAFLTTIGILLAVFARFIVGFFTTDAVVANHGVSCLQIVAIGFTFYAFGMVMQMSFNGAGDTFTPTLLNICVFWLFEIPLAYLLSYNFGLREQGVYWAILSAFSVLAVVATILFRRGKWKEKKV